MDNSAAEGASLESMVAMTFHDLPSGSARDLDLSDHTHAADVIDLITMEADRHLGCMTAMLCDERNRGVQPVSFNELVPGSAPEAMVRLMDLVLPLLREVDGSILMARGRPGPTLPTDEDRAWHQLAIERCRAEGVRLLGFHVATPDGVERLPDPLEACDVA